jgi:hypothetical protein
MTVGQRLERRAGEQRQRPLAADPLADGYEGGVKEGRPVGAMAVGADEVYMHQAFASDPLHHEITPMVFREFHLERRGFDPALWRLAWRGRSPASRWRMRKLVVSPIWVGSQCWP